ncbi:MAG TPA: hypothetical protein VF756_26525 [Thermoanaerobaculia bacterium]
MRRTGDLLARDFRANPRYELVLFDRLPAEERRVLVSLREDPDFYGVLRPREAAGLGVKSVDRDTALLFLTLREPGPLPAYVDTVLGEAAERTVARLVADGVLEVESGGSWGSGAAVLGLLRHGDAPEPGAGRLAELSVAALRYGQALAVDDPLLLSWRLYTYNRRPLTPRWQRLLPSADAVERFLGIDRGGAHRKLLDRSWSRLSAGDWLSWTARGRGATLRPSGATWKLYVSPAPEALAEGFGDVLGALAAARAFQFKVGSDAAGLLRPDKIVAYFASFERLAEAAGVVVGKLAGAPVQGVPFTSEIGGDGLLSWGVDPPPEERTWSEGESWRLWLTHRLARALLAARATAAEGVEPRRFALERLRLEGIDTATWTPGARVWREG